MGMNITIGVALGPDAHLWALGPEFAAAQRSPSPARPRISDLFGHRDPPVTRYPVPTPPPTPPRRPQGFTYTVLPTHTLVRERSWETLPTVPTTRSPSPVAAAASASTTSLGCLRLPRVREAEPSPSGLWATLWRWLAG